MPTLGERRNGDMGAEMTTCFCGKWQDDATGENDDVVGLGKRRPFC